MKGWLVQRTAGGKAQNEGQPVKSPTARAYSLDGQPRAAACPLEGEAMRQRD